MLNINFFGGPGVGKSVSAATLFSSLKKENLQVEYVTEFAKELTYSSDKTRLSDQLLILGEQHHRVFRLRDKVDIVIHDSPLVLSSLYLNKDSHLPAKEFHSLVSSLVSSYCNLNILLKRNPHLPFEQYGRLHTLTESLQKDEEVKQLLLEFGLPFVEVDVGASSDSEIYKVVKEFYESSKR